MADRIQQMLLRNQNDDFVLSPEAQKFLNKGAIIIRMRGLPYECTPKQVIDFFAEGEQSCDIHDGEDGILFVKKPDGRSTGDAFVQFLHESQVEKALSKHKELIGPRYIELFRTTPTEAEQVIRKSQETKPKITIPLPQQQPVIPQHILPSGSRKDCIRLCGLPYEAQVEHIINFLGENASNIVLKGVHMVFSANGQPNGEAFIRMDSEASASQAANSCNHRYMKCGSKHRYIKVFQCSPDEMNAFSSTSHVSPKTNYVINPGIENNIPGLGLSFPSTLLPYYEHPPPSLMPFMQPNPFLLNSVALQQQQSALAAASLINNTSSSTYPQWPVDMDPYKTSTASITTTTESIVKPKTTETEVLSNQQELFSPYSAQPSLYFLHPNVPRMLPSPMFTKQGFQTVSTPIIIPQITPQLPQMGMLGVKRSWEQAFPLETAAVQGAKRWSNPQVASFTTPGFYHDVG